MQRLRRAKSEARRLVQRRRLGALAADRKDSRDLCLVYGNCQAEGIRTLLGHSPVFANRYKTASIPAVHEIEDSDLAVLGQALPHVKLLICHPVRDGYRDRPLGTSEIRALLPDDARVVSTVPLYYEGLFPYQVYLHLTKGAMSTPAPITGYHDVRFLACAARGLSDQDAISWLSTWTPSPDALLDIATRSREQLLEREALVDLSVASDVLTSAKLATAFFTVNHPANWVLDRVVQDVHAAVGVEHSETPPVKEMLGDIRTPVERDVMSALNLDTRPADTWTVSGRRYELSSVMVAHLQWYREHPEALAIALDEHADRLRLLSLADS